MFPYRASQPRDEKVITGVEARVTRRSRGSLRAAAVPAIQPPPARRPNQFRRESAFGYNPYFGQPQNVAYVRDEEKPPEEVPLGEDLDENKRISYSRNWFHIREELGHVTEDKKEKFKREKVKDKPKRQRERRVRDTRTRSSGVEELRRSLFSDRGSPAESEYSLPEDTVPPKYSMLPQDMYATDTSRFDDAPGDYSLGYRLTEDDIDGAPGSGSQYQDGGKGPGSGAGSGTGYGGRGGPRSGDGGGAGGGPGAGGGGAGGGGGGPGGRRPPSGADRSQYDTGVPGCDYGYSPDMDDDGCLTQFCRALGKCMRWLCCPFVTYQERDEHVPEKCIPLNASGYDRNQRRE